MSKVIHLSDTAHYRAKAFCREHCLKMSDWVASLIDGAIAGGPHAAALPAGDNVRALVQKKKLLEQFDERGDATPLDDDDVGAAPPFWQQRAR